MNPWKPLELALAGGARLLWPAFQAINQRVDSAPFQPKWADRPLLKSRERSKPQFGWPRTTDSLCPTCVRETRARILSGEQAVESLVNEHVGEIESHIPGRDFPAVTDTLHNHGTSSIKYGRGAVLTIDLTNRCNMMCDPCFMD